MGMKEVVTKVIDTVTQEDFHGAFQKTGNRLSRQVKRLIYCDGSELDLAFENFLLSSCLLWPVFFVLINIIQGGGVVLRTLPLLSPKIW